MARPASALHEASRKDILDALEKHDGSVNDAAKMLGESVRTLYRVINEKGLTSELLRMRARVLEKK